MRILICTPGVLGVVALFAVGCSLLTDASSGEEEAPTPVYPSVGSVAETAPETPVPASDEAPPAQEGAVVEKAPSPEPEGLATKSDWCHTGCKRIFECRGDLQAVMGGAGKFTSKFGKTIEDCNVGCLKDKEHAPTSACKACMTLPCTEFAPCITKECF